METNNHVLCLPASIGFRSTTPASLTTVSEGNDPECWREDTWRGQIEIVVAPTVLWRGTDTRRQKNSSCVSMPSRTCWPWLGASYFPINWESRIVYSFCLYFETLSRSAPFHGVTLFWHVCIVSCAVRPQLPVIRLQAPLSFYRNMGSAM